jgi:hypothetical protein
LCSLSGRTTPLLFLKNKKSLQELNIPTVLKECASSFWKADKKEFVLSGTSLNPDIYIIFWAGPQVAVVAWQRSHLC